MRALVLTCDAPNQIVLVNRLREQIEVAGVVVSANLTKSVRAGKGSNGMVRAVANRTVGQPFVSAWFGLQDHYARLHGTSFSSDLRLFPVPEINAQGTLAAIAETAPDLLLVSGTNMVRDQVIASMNGRAGILNLHTGISPYVRGGPNCTNWCLANGWFHLIGNTVMWLDEGIDTGAILTTERTELTGSESLTGLQIKVMDHAHDLFARATSAVSAGRPVPRAAQNEIASGRTFYNREWNAVAMARARLTFARRFGPAALSNRSEPTPTLVPIPAAP